MAGKSFSKASYQKDAKQLKKLGLITYDLRRNFSPGQKATITRLAKKYSGVVDHPGEYVTRTVSNKTADLLDDSGYQTFKSKRTKKHVAVIPAKNTLSIKIKNNRLIREFESHTETSLLYLRHDIFEVLEREAAIQEEMYGDEPYLADKFFTIKIGESNAWKHFRTPADLLNYIQEWQPKDVVTPNNANYGNMNYKAELITQMALIERKPEKAITYDRGGNRGKTKKKARSNRR